MVDVSLIMVCYNAEEHIVRALSSYINQSLDASRLEIIVVDGGSSDNTKFLAEQFLQKHNVQYRMLDNPKRTLASGWNIALKASKGDFVCRIDAHSTIPTNYLKSAIDFLEKSSSKTVGVGGVLTNKGITGFGRIATDFYSSKFGVGNSPFRILSSGVKESDTSVFAVYRRNLFDSIGYFDETLGRNQDIDFHKRVNSSGYKLFTDYSLIIEYYVRSDVKSFLKKAYNDGFWVVKSGAFYLRHLVPLFFILYLLLMILFSFFVESKIILYPFVLYICSSIFYSIKDGECMINKLCLPILYFSYHVSYGVGSAVAFFKCWINKND